MRVEAAGARTWLLAGAALWAACVWVLAAFGLGGRVQALPEDPALLQPLPEGELVAEDPLGPLPQYAEIGERPLFAVDRRHRPFVIGPEAEDREQPDGVDLVLTSVLITPGLEMAIVQPRQGGDAVRFRVGEPESGMPGWSLTSVAPRSATFAGPEGEQILELRVFDGADDTPSAGREVAAEGREGPEQREPAMDEDNQRASQAESIRSRIEARRARLRAELD